MYKMSKVSTTAQSSDWVRSTLEKDVVDEGDEVDKGGAPLGATSSPGQRLTGEPECRDVHLDSRDRKFWSPSKWVNFKKMGNFGPGFSCLTGQRTTI